MNYNYIDSTRDIIKELKESGNSKLAQEVEVIFYGTGIQTELLGLLRNKFKESKLDVVPIATYEKIKELLKWIDEVF